MKTKFLVLVMLAVLIAAPSVAAALTVHGRAVDMEGNPVSKIKVYALLMYYTPVLRDFQPKASLKAAATANDKGEWKFSSLPKPSGDYKYWYYYFVASSPGKRLGWVVSSPKLASVPKEGFTIPAASLGTYEGQVTDKKGNPIAGAQVKMGVLLEIDEKCDPGG